jgi:hypothetical protein
MACEDCAAARMNPEWYRRYTPSCLWCGARYVQQLRRLGLEKKALDAWRTRVMDDWEAFGHDRQQLRELALAKEIPLDPEVPREGADTPSNRKRAKQPRASLRAGPAGEGRGAQRGGVDPEREDAPSAAGGGDDDA